MLHAIVLKYNAFRIIIMCLYATLRLFGCKIAQQPIENKNNMVTCVYEAAQMILLDRHNLFLKNIKLCQIE